MDARKDRTALRHRLYDQGFTPLANLRKMCLLKGWSTFEVTHDLIDSKEWARSGKFLDTGLRCGDIVALDWDIDDKDLLNDLLDEIVENGIVEESPFVRIGRPPRELWVYRVKGQKIGKRTTGHFTPPDAPEDHGGFAVEILGKGCQFAAFGQRDETHAYHWPEASPLDHPYMDLPEITLEQAEAVVAYTTAFFERNGLTRQSPGGGTDHGYTHVYDLEPDMLFEAHEIGEVSIAELTAILTANPDEVIRVKADPFRPTSGTWSCMASLSGGTLCISDHGTYTSHFPVEADMQRAASALGELLAKRQKVKAAQSPQPAPTAKLEDLNPRDGFDVNLKRALNRYVYATDENLIYDLMRVRAPGVKVEAFRNVMAQYYKSEQGKLGGEKLTWLADQFMRDPNRINISTAAMRPDMPLPIFEERGDRRLNTYRPPVHETTGGDAGIGLAFIDRLLPIPAERQYFLQWLSYKYQYPATRGPAIVMVAQDTYGTGRGSLMQLIGAMFADGLVNQIDFQTLAGTTYQSQYNEWLAENLIVVVNEAQEIKQSVSKWQARSNAYERLKEIVEPGSTTTNIMRKGSKNGPARSFCSIMVMTNHMDSVVLPLNDRRLAVLSNGTSMPQSYWDLFHAWLSDPANVAAFVRELVQVDLAGYSPFAAPPMTAAKADMVEAGVSEIDRLMGEVMATYSNTLICREQVVLRFEDSLAEHDLELPDDWRRVVERIFVRATRKLMGVNDRVKIDGKQRIVRVVGQVDPGAFSSPDKLIETVTSNGPVTRQVKTSGSVIAFRR